MENNGLKLDVLRDENTKLIKYEDESVVIFCLKTIDSSRIKSNNSNVGEKNIYKGRKSFKWSEKEFIEFNFDVDKEDPEKVIKELVY